MNNDDIVDRLWEGVWRQDREARVLLKLAAEEIKRLRAALAVKDNHDHFDCAAAMARKDAEIARLHEYRAHHAELMEANDGLGKKVVRLSQLLVEQTNRTNEALAREERLRDGIAEHKLRVDDPSAPAKAVHEYDRALWALIEEDDDE